MTCAAPHTVTYNGEPVTLDRPCTVAQFLTARAEREAGLAIALDGAVLPRSRWATTPLEDGAVLDALRATQGG